MKNDKYESIEEFKSQYIGEWAPSDGHWYGLDFIFHGVEYRLNTGSMYNEQDTTLPNGYKAVFGIYKKSIERGSGQEYVLLEEFATIDDVLKSTCIEGIPFSEVIMNEETQLIGQD